MPTVTAISRSKRSSGGVRRVDLALDGQHWGSMSDTLVAEFRLFQGKQLDDALLEELRERITQTDALIFCHASVASRASTAHELAGKLRARGYEDSVIHDTLERCRHLGLVDDERYAREFAAGRVRRGLGRRRIEQDLQRRGIERAVVDAALEEVVQSEAMEDAALAAARRKFGRADLGDVRDRARAQRFLLGRGFSYGQADAAIRVLQQSQSGEQVSSE